MGRTVLGPFKECRLLPPLSSDSWGHYPGLPPRLFGRSLLLHFFQNKDGEGSLALSHTVEGLSEKTMGSFPNKMKWYEDCYGIKLLPKKDRASLSLAPSKRKIGEHSRECKGLCPQQEYGGYRQWRLTFPSLPESREDSVAFCPEREWALSVGSFPPFSRVFQNMEDGKRWNRSLLHPRVPKAQPFSGKRSGGELATCPGGMAPDRLLESSRRNPFRSKEKPPHSCFAEKEPGRKSPAHFVYGRSFVWQEPAPRYFWGRSPSCLQKERREVLHAVGKNLGPLPNERRRAPPGQGPPPNPF